MTDDTYFQCLAHEPKHTRVKSSVVALARTDTTKQGAQPQVEQTADTERNEQEKRQIMRGYADVSMQWPTLSSSASSSLMDMRPPSFTAWLRDA